MEDRVGIIDLGSNTFHLLIVDFSKDNSFKTIHKERRFVGLAENGIEFLSERSMKKGLDALKDFKAIMENLSVQQFKVTGTAALRSAKNSPLFISEVKENLDIDIEIIEGKREAELIFKGVALIHPMKGNHLIMDVGGGSVEFILVRDGVPAWSKSYNIGVGVLHNAFHKSDPISSREISNLEEFLKIELKDLRNLLDDLPIESLIGASGSFEVVESMKGNKIQTTQISEVNLEDYWWVSTKVITASFEERITMEGLPESRVKLIVVAMILIDYIIKMMKPNKIFVSPYALKEGLLRELYD